MGYRLTIDQHVCTASGLCTRAAPMLFRTGTDGRTEVIGATVDDDLRWVAEEAVQRCPTQAISIERITD
jgi:ferredoxin